MSLAKIISIPGSPGLYKMVAQMRNGGYIVESLTDSRRIPVSNTQRIVMLEDISVYTTEGDIPLNDVFLKMKENDAECLNAVKTADSSEQKAALKKAVPDFDEERVHDSDIKKMFSWYPMVKDMVEKEPEPEKDDDVKTVEEENEIQDAAPLATKKKATRKKKTE